MNQAMSIQCSFPVSQNQQASWFLYKLNPEGLTDKVSIAVQIKSPVDFKVLKDALQALTKHHSMLRSIYYEQDGKIIQSIRESVEIDFQLIDASCWSNDELDLKLLQYAKHPFNLEGGSVFRACYFHFTARHEITAENILLLTVHQIAGDWESLLILISDFSTIYRSKVDSGTLDEVTYRGSEQSQSNLSSIDTSYIDYVQKELNFLQRSEGNQARSYWQQQLTGELPILELPTSSRRSSTRTYNGAAIKFSISQQLSQQIKQLANTRAVKPQEILLSVFKVLLYRYTGETDLMVGLLQSCRDQPLFQQVVGNLTNVVVVRSSISDSLSFTELLTQVSQTIADLEDYKSYPFALLVKQMKCLDRSHPPICQVAFGYYQLEQLLKAGALELELYELPQQRADFELSLEFIETEESWLGYFKYNSDRLEAVTVTQIAEHFQNLLTAVVENPELLVSRLPILSLRDQQQLLLEWNDTRTNDDLSSCIHQLFEAQVERTPEAVALVFDTQQLTYQELDRRANQLAHYLQKLGVKPETLVGICVERSLEMVVGLLGILKAGGAYVPLDPAYPSERIQYMLSDAQALVLLTQATLVDRLPTLNAQHIICLDTDWGKIAQENCTSVDSGVTPDNLAYVIYTSGSTGKPKGVQIYHRSLTNFLTSMSQAPGITNTDTLLAVTTICFDIAALELYLPLITGAKGVIVSREVSLDGWQLWSALDHSNATVMQATPATWQMLLTVGWSGNSRHSSSKAPEKKLKILCGGEALSNKLANQLLDTGAELWNLYGPTETTIWSSVYAVTRSTMNDDTSAPELVDRTQEEPKEISKPIGKPIANTQIYILDSCLQPVPVGVTGELYIGGVGVARGYLNRPDLTTEKFIPNPFEHSTFDIQSSRLYKTGDLARYLPDGNIEYLGRADYQVKVRGFRIETGEIETVLSQHPLVRETVVVAREDQSGVKHLVAYVVAVDSEKSHPEPLALQLKQHLKQQLAEYMVPSAFVVLPQLPLTPNGKVDRRALPAPNLSSSSESNNFVAPRDRVEQQLAEIWSEVLSVNSVGVKDNFFDLGGHSLLAVHLMAKIQRRFNKLLPLSTLFNNCTIEDLANRVREEKKDCSSLVAIQTQGTKTPFFCVHPAGGHVLCYLDLCRYLGDNQPCYGLQAQGFNEGETIFTTVEEMAHFYVNAIQELQPQGPYQIGGWSFGGVVAFEMAQQLLAKGQAVSLLAILDAWVPILLDPDKQIDHLYLTGVVSRYFGGIFGVDNLVSETELTGLDSEEKVEFIIDKAEKLGLFPPEASREQNRRFIDVMIGTLKATYAYKQRPYPGKVTVFRPQERHLHAPDPQLVWVELYAVLDAADVELVAVPGCHYSCLKEPNLKVLSERLSSHLQ